jgi:hypothetical protein
MRRILIALLSLIILAPLTSAQSPESPSTDDVKRFLEVMRIEGQLQTMVQIMTKSAKQGARQTFLQKMPDATPEQLADVESLTEGLFADLPMKDIIPDLIPVYQKHISKADLQALTDFYASPIGQRFLNEQPKMMQEMGEVSAARMQQQLGGVMEKFDTKLAEMVEKWKAQGLNKTSSEPSKKK